MYIVHVHVYIHVYIHVYDNYIDGKILSSYDKHVNHRNTLLRVLQYNNSRMVDLYEEGDVEHINSLWPVFTLKKANFEAHWLNFYHVQ